MNAFESAWYLLVCPTCNAPKGVYCRPNQQSIHVGRLDRWDKLGELERAMLRAAHEGA